MFNSIFIQSFVRSIDQSLVQSIHMQENLQGVDDKDLESQLDRNQMISTQFVVTRMKFFLSKVSYNYNSINPHDIVLNCLYNIVDHLSLPKEIRRIQ